MDIHDDQNRATMDAEVRASGVSIAPDSDLIPIALMRAEAFDRVVGVVLYDPSLTTTAERAKDVIAWLIEVRGIIEATHALGYEWDRRTDTASLGSTEGHRGGGAVARADTSREADVDGDHDEHEMGKITLRDGTVVRYNPKTMLERAMFTEEVEELWEVTYPDGDKEITRVTSSWPVEDAMRRLEDMFPERWGNLRDELGGADGPSG